MTITTTAPECLAHRRPLLVFPGGGIFFWWQAGVVRALQECYVMQDFDFAGASAGSLSAVFAACNVDMRDAFDLAFRLAQEHRVWDRPEGLAGIWGNMIKRWLQELLPENAAELCNARVYISVTHIQPSLFEPMKRNQISTFQSKEEVIDACMTSVHIPFFIDGNAVRDFRGDLCVDGSLLFFLQNVPWQTEAHEIEPAWVCNHNEDATLMAKNWSFLQTVSPECFEEMFELGYRYARNRAHAGNLSRLDLLASLASEMKGNALAEGYGGGGRHGPREAGGFFSSQVYYPQLAAQPPGHAPPVAPPASFPATQATAPSAV